MSTLKDKYPNEPFSHKLVRSLTRVSSIQLGTMMKYLYAHNEMVGRYPLSPSGKERVQEEWEQLANVLNGLEGISRAASGWKKIWHDYMTALNFKIQDLYLVDYGNPELVPKDTILPLTDLDKWVWTYVVGRDYGSFGHDKISSACVGEVPFEPFPEVVNAGLNASGLNNENFNENGGNSPLSSKPWPEVDMKTFDDLTAGIEARDRLVKIIDVESKKRKITETATSATADLSELQKNHDDALPNKAPTDQATGSESHVKTKRPRKPTASEVQRKSPRTATIRKLRTDGTPSKNASTPKTAEKAKLAEGNTPIDGRYEAMVLKINATLKVAQETFEIMKQFQEATKESLDLLSKEVQALDAIAQSLTK